MMSLRKKVFLVFVLALGMISAATYAVSYLVISRNFERLEDRIVRANLTRISNAVAHQQNHLDSTAKAYGSWNSTYDFMSHKYPDYPRAELSAETFNREDISVFLLVDVAGKIVRCRNFGDGRSVCGENDELVRMTRTVRRFADAQSAASGLVVVGGRPMQVAIEPIIRGNTSGPSRGMVVLGRWMDERQVRMIGRMVALPMTAVVASASEIHTASARADWNGEEQWIVPGDGEKLTGFVRIPDLYGGPGMVLTTEFHRDLLHEGRIAQRWLFAEIFAAALLLQLTAFVLLQKLILKRIAQLGATATSISNTGDLSERVVVSGRDEITALEISFNSMLQDMEKSRRELLIAQKTLEHHATHDALTGVLNRAAILARLRVEMIRARREAGWAGVMLIDLDHFKRVNDTFGHPTGDDVLRAVMESVKQTIRPYDFVGRYGGEEFLVVVPGVSEQEAMTVAQRVCNGVAKLQIAPRVTVSIGVTATNGTEDEKQALLAADTALYSAKQLGRNRVEFCAGQQQGLRLCEQKVSI